MKKTYIKPEIRIIELPKNKFIATSGPDPNAFIYGDEVNGPGFEDGGCSGFD